MWPPREKAKHKIEIRSTQKRGKLPTVHERKESYRQTGNEQPKK